MIFLGKKNLNGISISMNKKTKIKKCMLSHSIEEEINCN